MNNYWLEQAESKKQDIYIPELPELPNFFPWVQVDVDLDPDIIFPPLYMPTPRI